MISVSNLRINFKQISSKQDLKKNVVNVLFLNNLKQIKFKPALQNGRPIKVRYSLPILFK